MSTFESVSAKIGNVKAETKAIAKEVYEAAKAAGHEIWYIWGMGTSAEHSTGLALDLMVRNEAGGDWVRNYLWANRERLRLKHVIWEQHITSTVVQPGVRRKMADRGNPTANHFDHNHGLFFPGQYRPPAGGTTTPINTDAPLAVDGKLGPRTIAKWQKVMGTPVDGKIDEDNNGSALVRAVQIRLRDLVDHRLVVDGKGIKQDGRPYKTVGALQRYLGSPVDLRISVPVSEVVKALQRRLNQNRF